jgi:hypothetical protein
MPPALDRSRDSTAVRLAGGADVEVMNEFGFVF